MEVFLNNLLFFIEIATASKRNSSFLIILLPHYEHNEGNMNSKCNVELVWTP